MNPSGLLSTFSLGRPFHDLWEESWTQEDIVPGLEELIQFIRWEGLLPVWGHDGARAGALRSTANLTEEKEEYKLSRPNSRRVPASQSTLLGPGPSQVERDVAWAQGGGASCGAAAFLPPPGLQQVRAQLPIRVEVGSVFWGHCEWCHTNREELSPSILQSILSTVLRETLGPFLWLTPMGLRETEGGITMLTASGWTAGMSGAPWNCWKMHPALPRQAGEEPMEESSPPSPPAPRKDFTSGQSS